MMPALVDGNNPMALVPEITGPLRVQLRMRLNDFNEPYHAIFHWTDENSVTESSIYFAYGDDGIQLAITDAANGDVTCSSASMSMTIGDDVCEVRFEADGTNLKITVDGVVVVTCPSTVVPSNVARTHYLAESPNVANPRLLGIVTGVMVVNLLDNPPAHPRDLFRFMNFPTQILHVPSRVVASAYMRFDDTDRQWQRMFDFSNGEFDHGITCAKPQRTTDFRCTVFYGTSVFDNSHISASDVVVQNEWAFWEFEIAVNGNFIIRKDGNVLETQTNTQGHPPGRFRPHSFFGRTIFTFPQNENLQGVILGFRLDVEDNS